MEKWSEIELCEWLRTDCKLEESICERFHSEGVDGEVLLSCETVHDLKGLVPELQNGHAKKILLRKSKLNEVVNSRPNTQGYSPARQFAESSGTVKYIEGTFLVDVDGKKLQESGPDMSSLLHPVREFKEFSKIGNDNVKSFIFQAMRFALACVNSRTNGTIYFGIQDNTVNVLGTTLDGISPHDLTDRLKQCVPHIFQSKIFERIGILWHCLHNPKFVEVQSFRGKVDKLVIEIDVEPKYEFVQEFYFEVTLARYSGRRQTQDNTDKTPELYVRDGSGSKRLHGDERRAFIDKKIATLSSQRRMLEKAPVGHDQKKLILESMLQAGSADPLDTSNYLVLVVDKVSTAVVNSTANCNYSEPNNSSADELNFIGKYCKWRLVIDLNSHNGVRQEYERYHKTICTTIDQFHQGSFELESITDKTWWLHANGHDATGLPGFRLSQWEERREEVIISLVTQLRYISSKHCLAVFLFLSDVDGIMASIYRRLYNSNFCRMLYIAEYDSALENLRETTPSEKIEPFRNGMIGLPWKHVGNIFRTVSGQPDPECELATSSGALIQVKRDNWSNIEILGASEFRSIDCDDPSKQELFWKERYRFYCGNPVSWLNCALSPDVRSKDRHIIKRNEHEKLKRYIELCSYRSASYEIMTIYHQAGAGGSTLARHVLWDLRHAYKCGVIKSVSSDMHFQIEEMYRYGEENLPLAKLKPVILILDLPDQEMCRIFLNDLNKKKRYSQLVSVIIYCQRTGEESISSPILRATFRHSSDIFLPQKFSLQEKRQFLDVLDGMAKDQNLKREADLMLGFMALISDEVEVYVKETIKRCLSCCTDWEEQLLKYIALLNTYYCDDPDVPAAFFDFLIPEEFQTCVVKWHDLNNPCALFCTVNLKPTIGSVHCFRIKMYPIFARELLCHLKPSSSTLSETVLEFLNCIGFKSHSFSRRNLILMTTNMIRKRRNKPSEKLTKPPIMNDRTHTRYSDIINDILAEAAGNELREDQYKGALLVAKKAFDVLHVGWLKDPFLAQLVARVLCLEAKLFDEALEYAELATTLRPNHSFLLDTMGQIYKEKLKHQFPSFQGHTLSEFDCAIELARKAIYWFTSAVIANENEKEINYSPYIGHVDIYKSLYEMLFSCEYPLGPYGKEVLHTYLCHPGFIPEAIQNQWSEHHEFMKKLCASCEASLSSVLDMLTMMKPVKESQDQQNRSQKDKLIYHVLECYNTYKEFILSDNIVHVISQEHTTKHAWNRQKVTQMGGLNFHTIMELGMQIIGGVEKLQEMKRLLMENTGCQKCVINNSDIEKLLLVSLSLAASGFEGSDVSLLEISALCAQYDSVLRKRSILWNLVMSILLWPQKDMLGVPYNDDTFRRVLKDLKIESGLLRRRGDVGDESELESYLRTGRKQINYKMRNVFYLSKDGRNQKVVHKKSVMFEERWYPDDQFWIDPRLEEILSRVIGVIDGNSVKAYNPQMHDYNICVPIANTSSSRSHNNGEIVQFYLGFSWDGPLAFGVGPAKHSKLSSSLELDAMKAIKQPVT